MGLFQRGGQVRTTVGPNVKVKTIESRILQNVRKGSIVYTDDFLSYMKLGKHFKHGVVKHGKFEYVRVDIHSNNAESFWALFKRGYHGTYHSMSRKHLQRYVNEFAFRFNRRNKNMSDKFIDTVVLVSRCGRMPYKVLTA